MSRLQASGPGSAKIRFGPESDIGILITIVVISVPWDYSRLYVDEKRANGDASCVG